MYRITIRHAEPTAGMKAIIVERQDFHAAAYFAITEGAPQPAWNDLARAAAEAHNAMMRNLLSSRLASAAGFTIHIEKD